MGRSGTGKTTLLKVLGGLRDATPGSVVRVNGAPVDGPPEGVIFVFQDYAASLLPWRTVERNVVARPRGPPRAAGARAARDRGARDGRPRRPPPRLPVAAVGRHAAARPARPGSLAMRASVLLMDEPFGVARRDDEGRRCRTSCSRSTATRGATVVFVTHDIDEADLPQRPDPHPRRRPRRRSPTASRSTCPARATSSPRRSCRSSWRCGAPSTRRSSAMRRLATVQLARAADHARPARRCGRRSSRPACSTTSTCPRRRRWRRGHRPAGAVGRAGRSARGHTLRVVLLGWLVAGSIGIGLGLLLGLSTRAWRWSMASFEAIRAMPPDLPRAGRPAGLRLLGPDGADDHRLRRAWPVMINTIDGVRDVRPELLQVARMLRLSRLRRFARSSCRRRCRCRSSGCGWRCRSRSCSRSSPRSRATRAAWATRSSRAQQALQPDEMFAYVIAIGLLGVGAQRRRSGCSCSARSRCVGHGAGLGAAEPRRRV